jgi:hypothetical protein
MVSFARIHQRHPPRFRIACGEPPFRLLCHVEGDIRHVQEVVREVLLDHISPCSRGRSTKSLMPWAEYIFSDVPENRPPADLHHRLRLENGFFAKAGTETAGQDNGFHRWDSHQANDGIASYQATTAAGWIAAKSRHIVGQK